MTSAGVGVANAVVEQERPAQRAEPRVGGGKRRLRRQALRHRLVHRRAVGDAVAAADHGLAVHPPRHPRARREVVAIRVDGARRERAGVRPRLAREDGCDGGEVRVGVQVDEVVVRLPVRRQVLVAQARVDRELRIHTPVVLDKQAPRARPEPDRARTVVQRGLLRHAEEEIREVQARAGRSRAGARRRVIARVEPGEDEAAARVAVGPAVVEHPAEVAAPAERVPLVRLHLVQAHGDGLVRPDRRRLVAKAAHARERQRRDAPRERIRRDARDADLAGHVGLVGIEVGRLGPRAVVLDVQRVEDPPPVEGVGHRHVPRSALGRPDRRRKRTVAIGIGPAVLHAEGDVGPAPAAHPAAAAAASARAARGASPALHGPERLREPDVDVIRAVAGGRRAVVVLRVVRLVGQRVVLHERQRRRIDPRRRDPVVRERQPGQRIDQRDVRAREVAGAPRGRRHDRIRLVQVSAEAAVVVEEERLARLPFVDAGNLERPADVQRQPLIEIRGLSARVRRERVRRGIEGRSREVVGRLDTNAVGTPAPARHREPAGNPRHSAAAGPAAPAAHAAPAALPRHRARRRNPRSAAGTAKAAALRESARHEPALFTAHAGNAAGLTIGAESAHPAGHAVRTAPARPFTAHHHEEHRVDLAGRARGCQRVARGADRESRRKTELRGHSVERVVCHAHAGLLTGLLPLSGSRSRLAWRPGWRPHGSAERRGCLAPIGGTRHRRGRLSVRCGRSSRRCGRFRGFHARCERQRDVLLRPAGRLHHHVQRHGREAREIRRDRVGAGTGDHDRIGAVLAGRRRYRRAAGCRRHRETDARQARLASRGGAADDARRRLALPRRIGAHPRR